METFFLACFAIGLLFTLASVALGFVSGGIGHGGGHLGGHAVDHGGGHHVHLPHSDAKGSDALPLLNASSAVGGLTWFGAAGYLLTRLGGLALPGAILGALAVGALGWYLVARFLGLVLRGEVEMNPDDYRLEGTVGRVTVGIPAGGTGEVVYEKAGLLRSEAARAVGGTAIPRGEEVVITAYANGFATVQPWGEFLAERERTKVAVPAQPFEKEAQH
jgi:membrane protein implicated in regulation of membrane protease activity